MWTQNGYTGRLFVWSKEAKKKLVKINSVKYLIRIKILKINVIS